MKHAFLLIFILLLACGGKKTAIEQSQKEKTIPVKKEQSEILKTPVVIEISKTEVPKVVKNTKVIPPIPPTNKNIIIKDSVVNLPLKTTFTHSSWNSLLGKHVSSKGNVNYIGFKNDRNALSSYLVSLSENRPTNTWSKQEKMAYWINAYNAMTIDLIIRNYPVKSIKDIKDPWKQRLWKLGKKWYNLDEIEHKILRKMGDARIHFAIVCASYSCPKLINKAFIASNIDFQLDKATKDFLKDPEKNSISQNNIKISKIFKWFAEDFKKNGSLKDFLNEHLEFTISKNAKKSYMDYNWNLNQ